MKSINNIDMNMLKAWRYQLVSINTELESVSNSDLNIPANFKRMLELKSVRKDVMQIVIELQDEIIRKIA